MSRISALAMLLASAIGGTALAQAPSGTPETVSYSIFGPEFTMRAMPTVRVLQMEAVQQELKLTERQKKRQAAIVEQLQRSIRTVREKYDDREIFAAARNGILADTESALQQNLDPEQRDRLDQILVQIQGPWAFERGEFQRRLGLTSDQVDEVTSILDQGQQELNKATSFSMDWKPKGAAPSIEEIRTLVDGLEFQLMKEKTRHLAHATRIGVMVRIVKVLTEPQHADYRKMLGAPFDTGKLQPQVDEKAYDVREVAWSLGLGGQRADLVFDVKIARPAYTTAHKKVFIDEAHHNFHTAGGRYKPFADLIGNDGYSVVPSKETFTRKVLETCDILVIANAMGAERMGSEGADKSAFTEDECQAVHDWVQAGGALLLITDHAPFGAAAESLAKRFGVEMGKTVAHDEANVDPDTRGLVFSREKKLLGDHPITRGRDDSERINRVKTFTGQSLKGPPGSVSFLNFSATATVGPGKDKSPAAGRSQGLALKYGQGRVVVLGEAAQLSAQLTGLERTPSNMMGMNVPGCDNRQMALNIMHWLSGILEPRGASRRRAG